MTSEAGGPIKRRAILKGMAAGVAGAVASGEAPVRAKPVDAEQAARPSAPVEPGTFLDEHLRRTLSSLADVLVPGSVAAGVVAIIDKIASVDAAPRQRQLIGAIARFDQQAQAQHGTRWIDLPPAAQVELLRRASEAPVDERRQFDFLRTTIINTYLATEAGQKEFGWVGQNAFRELPGCPHPAGAHD